MPKTTEKQWTVMVYLAGDNNLDSAGVIDLKEMKKVGSSDRINVIAQFDRQGKDLSTNRYYIRKGSTLPKDIVGSLARRIWGTPVYLRISSNGVSRITLPSITCLSFGTTATAGTMRTSIVLQETCSSSTSGVGERWSYRQRVLRRTRYRSAGSVQSAARNLGALSFTLQ